LHGAGLRKIPALWQNYADERIGGFIVKSDKTPERRVRSLRIPAHHFSPWHEQVMSKK